MNWFARPLIVAGFSLCALPAQAQPTHCTHASAWWCDSRRGWHFYDDPKATPPTGVEPPGPAPSRPPELTQLALLRHRVDEYRGVALMNPTEANVRRYMELEAKVVAQASRFADVARRVAWSSPDLDMTLQGRPVNAKALEVFERDQSEGRATRVAALAKDHVLLFFFRSDCPYCHAFAPTLQAFESQYGLQVVPLSIDGGGLPGFAAHRRDNGIARTLGVSHVPAVYLAQPFAGKLVPIGFGLLSEAQLLERIATVTTPQTDAMLAGADARTPLR